MDDIKGGCYETTWVTSPASHLFLYDGRCVPSSVESIPGMVDSLGWIDDGF